jgi:acetoacetate decarboxylase
MRLAEVRRNAFAMLLNDPAYPPGLYKFYNREFIVVTHRTDPDRLREVVSAIHYITDLTLGLGEAVFDYLKDA